MMMPDVQMTVARRAGFYQAGVASGGIMSHGALESSVRLGLGKFSTSQGSDAAVAAMLSTRGMVPGSKTFGQTVTAVGQAARYLNMPNEVAASALEGLTSGPTSANMMRNFGVFTGNPVTGEAMSQSQIFEQLAQRFTGGRQTTVEGTMESLRRGNLGSNIRNSGLDPAQQALLSQYMIDRSRGINMDLSDPNAIGEAIKRNEAQGISNPMLEQYRQNAQDNQLMERATESYLDGISEASDALIELKKAVEGLPDMFFKLKGGLDFFMGDRAGQGVVGAGASVLGGAAALGGQALQMYGGYKALQALKGGGGASPAGGVGRKTGGRRIAGQPAAGKKFDLGKSVGKGVGKGFGLGAVASIGGTVLGDLISGGSDIGSAQSKIGNALGTGASWAGMGAMIGSVVPGLGTGIGAAVGGGLGALYGAFTGGPTVAYTGKNSGGGSGTITPGGNSSAWAGAYGESRYYGTHQGIDIPLAVNTKVYAAANGKVIAAQEGQGERSYGLYVKIKHSDKFVTMYAHLNRIDVRVGQEVTQGQQIGLSGNTGFSTGPHLHFGLYKDGIAVDPSGWIAEDLTGGTERYSAGNNGGQAQGKQRGPKGAGIMDLILNPSASASSAASAISISSSGVKGRQFTSAGIVGATMSGGVRGLSSGVEGALAGDAPAETGTGGGMDIFTVQDTSSKLTGIKEDSSSVVTQHVHKNNITIQVTVPQATEAEAKKFAKMIKEQLEEDSMLSKMGRK
jgi:hypothetical protein